MPSVVVVTGAASGMGRACLERVRGLGDVLVAVDVRDPGIEGTVGVVCDISDPSAVAALAARVAQAGSLRALIHAAGLSPTMADGARVLEVNLVGTQLLLDAFDPLVGPGSAAVLFASSAAYHLAPYVDAAMEAAVAEPLAGDFAERTAPYAGHSGFAYGVSKVGVQRAARRAAVTWGRRGGRVNSLSPGIIDTPMGRQEFAQQEAMRGMVDQVPSKRLGTADELAAVAAFLVSDAASFINGIDILADGGGHATALTGL